MTEAQRAENKFPLSAARYTVSGYLAKREREAKRARGNVQLRARLKAWAADNPEKRKRHIATWQAKNPEKRTANVAVSNALRDGRLMRLPCEVCQSPKTEAHHDDYSKPLQVRWLCPEHHGKIRRKHL